MQPLLPRYEKKNVQNLRIARIARITDEAGAQAGRVRAPEGNLLIHRFAKLSVPGGAQPAAIAPY